MGKMAKRDLQALIEVRKLCTFDKGVCSFWEIGPPDVPLPTSEQAVDAFIRERTRNYREAHILSLLDQLIRRAKGEE